MTDREKAIKGLELCKQDGNFCYDKQCPYEKNFPKCVQSLISDALELLKAQEPRVLTLEEVKDRIGEAIYFESRGTYMGKVVFPILPALFTSHGLMRYVHPQSSHYSELGLHDYGIVWRCWTSRPTDEQREEAPWPC